MGKVISLAGHQVEVAGDLMGFRWWMQVYEHAIPRFEVYQYVGKSTERALYFFQGWRDGAILMRYQAQITRGGFQPFLLNTSAVESIMDEYKE